MNCFFYFLLAQELYFWYHMVMKLEPEKSESSPIIWEVPPAGTCKKILYVVWTVFTEILSLIALIALYPFSPLISRIVVNKDAPGPHVILVHGYLHNASGWIYFLWRAKNSGLGPVHSINLGWNPFRSLENYADVIKAKIEAIQKKHPGEKFQLVGHSMGGVDSVYTATNKELLPFREVTHVATLGSPLKGTVSAKIGFGQNARAMEPKSSFLKKLEDQLEKCDDVRFYNVAAINDPIVFPYTTSLLKTNKAVHRILRGVGHAGLLFSPTVINQTIEWLKQNRYTVLA